MPLLEEGIDLGRFIDAIGKARLEGWGRSSESLGSRVVLFWRMVASQDLAVKLHARSSINGGRP
jgi:hypothetical protein